MRFNWSNGFYFSFHFLSSTVQAFTFDCTNDLQNTLCWHILHYSCRCSKIHVFLYHAITYQQIKIFYHITPSVACLPTLRALLSPPTVCFLIVKQFLVWVGDLTLPCTAFGRMHTGADAFVVQQDTPIAPASHRLTRLVSSQQYSMLDTVF